MTEEAAAIRRQESVGKAVSHSHGLTIRPDHVAPRRRVVCSRIRLRRSGKPGRHASRNHPTRQIARRKHMWSRHGDCAVDMRVNNVFFRDMDNRCAPSDATSRSGWSVPGTHQRRDQGEFCAGAWIESVAQVQDPFIRKWPSRSTGRLTAPRREGRVSAPRRGAAARNSANSCKGTGFPGPATADIRATVLPRRVITTSRPASTLSSNSLKRALACSPCRPQLVRTQVAV